MKNLLLLVAVGVLSGCATDPYVASSNSRTVFIKALRGNRAEVLPMADAECKKQGRSAVFVDNTWVRALEMSTYQFECVAS